jgi:hypothetical protein
VLLARQCLVFFVQFYGQLARSEVSRYGAGHNSRSARAMAGAVCLDPARLARTCCTLQSATDGRTEFSRVSISSRKSLDGRTVPLIHQCPDVGRRSGPSGFSSCQRPPIRICKEPERVINNWNLVVFNGRCKWKLNGIKGNRGTYLSKKVARGLGHKQEDDKLSLVKNRAR